MSRLIPLPRTPSGFGLADYRPLLEGVPETLVPRHRFTVAGAVALDLPIRGLSYFLERPLPRPGAPADSALDLGTWGSIEPGGRVLLSRLDVPEAGWDVLSGRPGWDRLRSFFRLFRAPHLAASRLTHFWLELDLAEDGALPAPNVHIHPAPLTGPDPDLLRTTRRVSLCDWLCDEGLPCLLGRAFAHPALLRQVFAAIPDGASPFAVGAMLGRESDRIRMGVSGLVPAGAVSLVASLGDPAARALETTLGEIAGLVPSIALQLDVGSDLGPAVGVECTTRAGRVSALAEWLVRRGLCDGRTAAGLGSFARTVEVRPAGADGSHDVLLSDVQMVKVVVGPSGPVAAKAYLYFQHRRVARMGQGGGPA